MTWWMLWLAGTARGADAVSGANLLAQGGVGAAAAADNAAITLNPGLLALHRRYDFMGAFAYGPGGGLHWSASAMDGRTSNRLAAGLAYSGDVWEPELAVEDLPGWQVPGEEIRNVRRLHDFAGGLGFHLADRRVALGLTGALNRYDHDQWGDGWEFDLHGGVGLRPIEPLVIGVAVRNFLPLGDQNRPTQVLGGVALADRRGTAVEVDVGWQERDRNVPISVGAGLQIPIETARLRGGYRFDAQDAHWLTVGGGWEESGTGLEYGLAVPLSAPSLAGTVHQISVRFGATPEIAPPG